MDLNRTALVLIGFQNDFFNGSLSGVFDSPEMLKRTLENTTRLIEGLNSTQLLIVSTPIIFTPDYRELSEPTGILKSIKEAGALKAGNTGSEMVKEIAGFSERIRVVPGKRGLNAFSNTELEQVLSSRRITNIVMAGVVTSICIDSTARFAYENGYRVSILSDCTSGRSAFEQDFYCEKIFPLYSEVLSSDEFMGRLTAGV